MAGPFSSAASGFSGAVASLFEGFAHETKSKMFKIESQADLLKGEGARLEGASYGLAHDLALQNKAFTEQSTAIGAAQADRSATQVLGKGRAAIGASGLQESGSAIDVLADSARQTTLERQVLVQQGLISEAGYQEEADSYANMQKAAGIAVEGSQLASKEHLLAADAEETAATGAFIGAGVKAATGALALFAL